MDQDPPAGATHWDGPPLSAWAAWRPEEAARRLAGVDATWCVVGGWAIDLWLGFESRPHEDLEVAILHADFPAVRRAMSGFRLHAVGDGEVRALAPDAVPPPDKHQTWVLDDAAQAWRMDIMREPGDPLTWAYRREPSLTRPRAEMIARSREGIAHLRPEGALLFKAKAARPKDQADFDICLPRLDPAARAWLAAALRRFHPGHPWIARLA